MDVLSKLTSPKLLVHTLYRLTYYYQLVIGISFPVSQTDPIKRLPLYCNPLIICYTKYGAIQLICDTLGGRGGGSKNVTRQFLLGVSLVKVDKKCHMGGGGGGG